jgi:hypothetical protein
MDPFFFFLHCNKLVLDYNIFILEKKHKYYNYYVIINVLYEHFAKHNKRNRIK